MYIFMREYLPDNLLETYDMSAQKIGQLANLDVFAATSIHLNKGLLPAFASARPSQRCQYTTSTLNLLLS